MQKLEGYLQSFIISLMVLGGTMVALFWGTQTNDRSNSSENSVELQQEYKVIYDRIQYGTPYQEIDGLITNRLRTYCDGDAPQQQDNSPEQWCYWQGAPSLTLSVKFDVEGNATEKKLYYDKEIGLDE